MNHIKSIRENALQKTRKSSLCCVCFITFLFSTTALVAQTKKTALQIEPSEVSKINLSQFAKHSSSIPLDKEHQTVLPLFISNDYLFFAGKQSIVQFDKEGHFIREFKCYGYVNGISGDNKKQELYVATSKTNGQIEIFDFDGNVKTKHTTEQQVTNCFCFEDKLWLIQAEVKNDSIYHSLAKMDLSTGNIIDRGTFFTDYYTKEFQVVAPSCFSVLDNKLHFAVNTDSTMYRINNDTYAPFLTWQVNPPQRFLCEKGVLAPSLLLGRYLVVNYNRCDAGDSVGENGKSYLLLKDRKSGENFQTEIQINDIGRCVNGIKDDIFASGYIGIGSPTNIPNCFYFTSTNSDSRKTSVNLIFLKD